MTEQYVGTPRLGTLIETIVKTVLSDVHTCLPGIVQSYDATNRVADILPTVLHRIRTGDGQWFEEEYPVIPDVPIAFPAGSGFGMTMPISVGDEVVLVFSEQSFDHGRDTVVPASPLTGRRFDLADAIAIPGSISKSVGAASSTHAVFGRSSGAVHVGPDGTIALGATATPLDSVATANKVLLQLQALLPVLTALSADLTALAAIPQTQGIGATTAAAIATLLGTAWPASVAASKVKVDP